jgi:hypothetical protein
MAEEVEGPVRRYAELFRQILAAGGDELAAARGLRLWHRVPSGFNTYARNGRKLGFATAWTLVPEKYRARVDERMREAGVSRA